WTVSGRSRQTAPGRSRYGHSREVKHLAARPAISPPLRPTSSARSSTRSTTPPSRSATRSGRRATWSSSSATRG
ncbi:MAG: hypothetical protein AVDCRST_MAG45-2520, partial [uncultured Solirubrobacterales bacterium]